MARIVRKLDTGDEYRSMRLVYNTNGLVRYVIGEEWNAIDELDWVAIDDKEYAVTTRRYTWANGRTYGQSRGGDLATLDVAHYENVPPAFEPEPGYGQVGYWVGAYQELGGQEPAGGWKWAATGQDVYMWDGWQPGEPDDGGGQDHDHGFWLYVEATTNGLADDDGSVLRRALIERPAEAGCDPSQDTARNYARTYAWEFRYDSPRQRYLRRELDPDTFEPVADEWSDYDGTQIYSDFTIEGNDAVEFQAYLAGVAQVDVDDGDWSNYQYYHGDQIGSTRLMSDATPAVSRTYVYTAFGELVDTSGTADTRYRYAGAWGYQSHDTLPFIHVGARLYDPETGRFLQRDPIGIDGGFNVYAYVGNRPIGAVDPSGLLDDDPWLLPPGEGPQSPEAQRGQNRGHAVGVALICSALYAIYTRSLPPITPVPYPVGPESPDTPGRPIYPSDGPPPVAPSKPPGLPPGLPEYDPTEPWPTEIGLVGMY